MNPTRLLVTTGLSLAFVACASAPPTRYHSLIRSIPPVVSLNNAPAVVLVRLDVPEALHSKNIITLDPDGSLKFSPNDKWLSSFADEAPRLFAMEIGRALKTDQSIYAPLNYQSIQHAIKISLSIETLQLIQGKGAEVSLQYKITRPESESTGRIVSLAATRSSGAAELIEALRGALEQCAQDLATKITGKLTEK